jgi:hypothetical protein
MPWECTHDGQGGHVEGNARCGLEGRFVHLAPAPYHVPGPAGRLHDDCGRTTRCVGTGSVYGHFDNEPKN